MIRALVASVAIAAAAVASVSVRTTLTILIAATTSVAAAGKIVAVYSGDGSFAPSTSGPMVWATVVNAASFTSTGFAPEQSATIFGADFPAAPTVTVADDGGTARIAKVTFASPAQINFVIPASLPDGPAIVAVGGQTVPIMIVKVAPGLFPNGLQIIRVRPDGSQTLEDATAPITMGADTLYLALYGTGVRNRSDLKNVTCTINGLSLPVVFAGAQPEFPGLDQIDLLLPVSLSGAGKVDVSLAVDGQTSNTVTLSFQ